MNTTRKILISLASLLTVAGAVSTTAALADTPTTAAQHLSARPSDQLAGTWSTTVRLTDAPPGVPPTFKALDTFEPGGGLVVSSSAANPAQRGLAHGAWTHVGHRNFTSTFVWFRFDATGQPVGTQRVRRTMEVSRQGTSFTATDTIEIVAPSGAVVATFHGTEAGERLPG